ncbi:MAG: aminotransferase class IV family protein [Ferruginibacter sp.]|nr:aminotransferase class IV family protein [Ferruginibacter sp.]
MNYFNYNGKIYKEGSPVIGADSRGLRYGDGLFETMKMRQAKLICEDEHFSRLWKGLNVLQFDIPKHFTVERMKEEIYSLAKKNDQETAARIRLNIVRGNGGLYDVKSHVPAYIIQTWPLAESNEEWNSNGLVLGIYEAAKKSCDILSNLKHNNYLPYVLAALAAKKEKWNDAIILNTNGRICDTTIANIFCIKDNLVYTPSLNEGCVAGIMRKMLIKNLLRENREFIEKELTVVDLLTADEVFLTNSIYNIRWVQRIGDISYRNMVTQEIFTGLIQTIL